MIKRLSAATVALTILLAGCDSLRDAMSPHSSVAAKAAGTELTVTELAGLMGTSQAPLRKDIAQAVADAWVNYHLAGKAAANNDSIKDPTVIDKAMWATIGNVKARKWYELVSKTWRAPDSSEAEGFYNSGRVLAANHILLLTQGLPDSAKATMRKKADAIRSQVNSANFGDLARRNSQDPGSKDKSGSLGTFPRGAMVAPFEQALLALKPHLFLAFGLVLLAWGLARRAHLVLLGGVAGLAATLILPLCLRPSLWSEYSAVLSSAMLESEFIPTVSSVLRRALHLGAAWTQFVPGALGCLWALWYFHRHAKEWDWNQHGSLLLLVSVWVAPYSWFTDEIAVLPGILQGIYWSADCGRSNTGFGVVNGMALLGVVVGISVGSGFYIWTTTAWLGWYVWAVRGRSSQLKNKLLAISH